ncbi:Ecotropic viral integration site 5 protein [Oryzias melastigma]|uniref:Ecotropic viral integration site 5 protein n=1 Tax=Oryzias melastigma TaxID=30732 RepID=A0A834C6F8_ORYME|nr:Ecotropic viral integration site 5 protein [Oryzias melastigma]
MHVQLQEIKRKQAEIECKSKEEVMAVRLREADNIAAMAELQQHISELEIQKEEGKVQGQLNHTDSSQYIRDLKDQIEELKHEADSDLLLKGPEGRLSQPTFDGIHIVNHYTGVDDAYRSSDDDGMEAPQSRSCTRIRLHPNLGDTDSEEDGETLRLTVPQNNNNHKSTTCLISLCTKPHIKAAPAGTDDHRRLGKPPLSISGGRSLERGAAAGRLSLSGTFLRTDMPRSFLVKSKKAHSYHQPRNCEDDYSRLDTILAQICAEAETLPEEDACESADRYGLSPDSHRSGPPSFSPTSPLSCANSLFRCSPEYEDLWRPPSPSASPADSDKSLSPVDEARPFTVPFRPYTWSSYPGPSLRPLMQQSPSFQLGPELPPLVVGSI